MSHGHDLGYWQTVIDNQLPSALWSSFATFLAGIPKDNGEAGRVSYKFLPLAKSIPSHLWRLAVKEFQLYVCLDFGNPSKHELKSLAGNSYSRSQSKRAVCWEFKLRAALIAKNQVKVFQHHASLECQNWLDLLNLLGLPTSKHEMELKFFGRQFFQPVTRDKQGF